jgi:GGDEF domain-containing protein
MLKGSRAGADGACMGSPLTSRSAPLAGAAARLAWLRQHAFFARLMLTVALTLIGLGGAQYLLLGERIESGFVRAGEISHAADARSIEHAYGAARGEEPLEEAEEVVSYIAHRPHVTGVALIDARGVVVAAADPEEVGQREPEQTALLRSGGSYAGPERETGENRANFEYVAPLRLGGERHALETDLDGALLREELDSLERSTLLLSLAGLLLAVPFFYLLGGRSLSRLHRVALNRATHDGLTDLGNQSAFQDELRRATATALRYGEPLSVASSTSTTSSSSTTGRATGRATASSSPSPASCNRGGRRIGRSASAATSSRSSCRARTSTARRSDSTARDRRPPRSSAA